ncbi:MAG: response regulator [Burkholderiales bacterium]|nr:MAG: response regulator [Burkholderiales bacterium]
MSQAHRIVLVGFSSFEKVTFESFFRLAARRPPGYVLVEDPEQAHLAVVNADDAAVLRQCIAKKPAAHVLLIGAQDGGTGWMLQRRPLNLMKVLATVESLLAPSMAATVPADLTAMRSAAALPAAAPAKQMAPRAAPAAPASPALEARAPAAAHAAPTQRSQGSNAGVVDSKMRRSVRTGAGNLPRFESSRAMEGLAGIGATRPTPADSALDLDHILVVDDSDIALKFMRNRLSRFGFHADLVNSGEEALGKMNTRPYKFVFLDVMMEGLDGYQTCRAIKQRKYSDGKPPVVVMLTSRGGTIDKIRGTLAGCDAYLTKPLNERDLIAVLAKHDRNVARGFQQTNFGGNSSSGFAKPAGG